mmetsp:Transcript_11903/g.26485  ORF Transcript_11903/g.26485 Transcript_11903/m.26485 type:complete len:150 (+) Transcript_11903:77-526(+)
MGNTTCSTGCGCSGKHAAPHCETIAADLHGDFGLGLPSTASPKSAASRPAAASRPWASDAADGVPPDGGDAGVSPESHAAHSHGCAGPVALGSPSSPSSFQQAAMTAEVGFEEQARLHGSRFSPIFSERTHLETMFSPCKDRFGRRLPM